MQYGSPASAMRPGVGPDRAIPGLSLDPADAAAIDGKASHLGGVNDADASSTISGWVSRVVGRTRGDSSAGGGRYAPVNQTGDGGDERD